MTEPKSITKHPTLKDLARFFSKVQISVESFYNNSPCWEWIAGKSSKGYGSFKDGTRTRGAHCVTYEWFIGLVPKGLELDHLCRNRQCVAPHHLEPVTHSVNILRGESPSAKCKRKTHCSRGHEFAEGNIYYTNNGTQRHCRACQLMLHKKKDNENPEAKRERNRANWIKRKNKRLQLIQVLSDSKASRLQLDE